MLRLDTQQKSQVRIRITASQYHIRIGNSKYLCRALRGQNGISTWLPARSGVVMVILDAQDPTAAAKGDFAISADGASLVTPPAVISGGHRRALLYDVVPRPADITGAGGIAPDHIVVAAGSGGGWEVSGVVSLPGKAIEWANRLHGRVPRTLTPDGPLTPSGCVLVHSDSTKA